MIKTLMMSLKIDMTYAINSFLYQLKRLPIFKDLLTDDVYQGKVLKKVIRILSLLLSFGRLLLYRFLYFLVIYMISNFLNPDCLEDTFLHIFFFFTVIGMFIHNSLLGTSTKRYFCILVFQMDATSYMKANLWWNIFLSTVLNSIFFVLFSTTISYSVISVMLLILFGIFARVIGEAFHIKFYRRFGYFWYHHVGVYFVILGFLLMVAFLPYVHIFIPFWLLISFIVVSFFLFLYSLFYLYRISDYKLMYQRLNTKSQVMNSSQAKAYSRQAMVMVRDKDKFINSKKIQGKKGYDLFNTIFFERHKEILMRSAKNYAFLIFVFTVGLSFFVWKVPSLQVSMNRFLLQHLGWFVLIMYFINRGAIVTQAMFYNCDHAMLCYNFYREPKVLLHLFFQRLKTIIKVNLLPAFMIALGVDVLFYCSGGTSILNYIMVPLFLIVLSIFFSVHYLVIYYLLQPYNQNMEMKSISYSLVSMLTYFFTYTIHDIVISSLTFSCFGLLFTLLYILIALILVYKKACITFRIKS